LLLRLAVHISSCCSLNQSLSLLACNVLIAQTYSVVLKEIVDAEHSLTLDQEFEGPYISLTKTSQSTEREINR
jgi:hypothetical protein